MKKLLLLIMSWLFASLSYAQYSSPGVKIKDDLQTVDFSREGQHGKKAANSNKVCRGDTLDYARYKAGSGLVGISTSIGYQLGQFYEAPGEVTITGFDFYAWQSTGTKDTVTLYCHIYNVGRDSLPTGSPVRSDTIQVDSTFGSGVLSGFMKRAVFAPYKTKNPYVLVVESKDSIRVAVVSNSYQNRAGQREFLGRGTIGNRWYNFRDLNIGGAQLDCDMALEPHVQYSIYNDFEFDDCFNYNDTVKFKNTSSRFTLSKMYNRYVTFGIGQYSHYWDFDDFFRGYYIDADHKYSRADNYEVKLYTSHYALRGGSICRDTTVKTLHFKPQEIIFSGDRSVCTGNSALVRALTNGDVYWYDKYLDTAHVYQGDRYSFGILEESDTIYAQSHNLACSTQRKTFISEVTKTPELPTVTHDSVCQNAKANLSARTDIGIMRWYLDSASNSPVLESDVLEVGPLKNDTFFFVKAFNQVCTHPGKVRVQAYVSSDFAPEEPVVDNDTTICKLDGDITLSAKSVHKLRWYNVPSGGSIIDTTNSLNFYPDKLGDNKVYVESFDGRCPSSRLPIQITVHHFDTISKSLDYSFCIGDTAQFDFSPMRGNLYWYPTEKSANPEHTGLNYMELNLQSDTSYYLLPFHGVCLDTTRHKLSVEAIPFGKANNFTYDSAVCEGSEPQITMQTDMGDVTWYDQMSVIGNGNQLFLGPLTEPFLGFYDINNRGCVSQKTPFSIITLLQPEAGIDYQINAWRNVEFLSKHTGEGSYYWDFDDQGDTAIGTDVYHNFSGDGDYNVRLIVVSDDGCTDTAYRKITINTVGIGDISNAKIDLYPVPTNGLLMFRHHAGGETWDLKLVDISGKKLIEKSALGGEIIHFDLSEFADGMYFLHKIGEGDIFHRVVIKQ